MAAQALIQFGPDCDGNGEVLVASGSYLTAIGASVPLDLDMP